MTKLEIKSDIVDNQTATVYGFYGLDAVSPESVSDVIKNASDGHIDVEIASNGGDVFAASEIYTMLKNYGGTVNVQVQGLAASAASVIAMAGDKVSMSPTAMLMIHQAMTDVQGNKDDMLHEADVLDKIDKAIVPAYEAKTGMSEPDLLNLMQQESWMTAKDAVDKGFADEISDFGDSDQLYAASTGMMLSPKAIAAGKAALAAKKDVKDEATTPAPERDVKPATAPQPEPSKPTLRQQKLAFLMRSNA